MPLVTSGVENGNLRELALRKMKELNYEVLQVLLGELIALLQVSLKIHFLTTSS